MWNDKIPFPFNWWAQTLLDYMIWFLVRNPQFTIKSPWFESWRPELPLDIKWLLIHTLKFLLAMRLAFSSISVGSLMFSSLLRLTRSFNCYKFRLFLKFISSVRRSNCWSRVNDSCVLSLSKWYRLLIYLSLMRWSLTLVAFTWSVYLLLVMLFNWVDSVSNLLVYSFCLRSNSFSRIAI